MDHESLIIDESSEASDVPASVQPPDRYPRWPWYVAALLFVMGVAIAIVWPMTVPYYTMSPGPVYDTSDFVTVVDGNASDEGELFFLTVSLKEANLFEYAMAKIDSHVTITKRENVRPTGVSPEDLRRESLHAMSQSKSNAIVAALTTLGYQVTYTGTGALVIETVPDSAADGVLMADDIILEMDGQAVAFRSDIIDRLSSADIGDTVSLGLQRPDAAGGDTFDDVSVELTLGPHVDDPSRPMIGVLIGNNTPIIDFPVDVTIDSRNIGGPSAGLMFALQIMDQLTDEPMTNGHRVAGTGTITADGEVGSIGGIRQKVFAAIDAGAVAVLVPAANYDDAVGAAGDDIEVVRIGTIADAVAFLESL